MTSVPLIQAAGVGIEPTSRRSERPILPLDDPAVRYCLRHAPSLTWSRKGSGGRNRTYGLLIQSQASLPAATTPDRASFQECPAGVEPALPGWKPGTFAARPRAQVVKRKERELNPQGCMSSSRFERGAITNWLALPFHQSCGGRNRTCVVAVNSRLPVPARAPPHHKSQDVGKSGVPRAPGARDRWFKSSRPDFCNAVGPVLVRAGGC